MLFSFVYNICVPLAPIWPEGLGELILDARVHRQKSERLALRIKAAYPPVKSVMGQKKIIRHINAEHRRFFPVYDVSFHSNLPAFKSLKPASFEYKFSTVTLLLLLKLHRFIFLEIK